MSGSLGNPPWCVSCRGNQKPGERACPRCNAAWKVPIPKMTTMKFFQDYFLSGTSRSEADVEHCPCICIKLLGTNLSWEEQSKLEEYTKQGYVTTIFPEFPVEGIHMLSPIFREDLKLIVKRMQAETGLMRSLEQIEGAH